MNYNKALDNGSGGPDEISDQQIKGLIQKFQRKGFDGLALEEVATALIIPNFGKVFQQHTGLDWQGKFEVKAFERLNRSKFDINWMARKDNSEHSALFINCSRGDLVKVRQYLKESKDPQIKVCVDQTKKSPLHVATIEGHLSIVEILLMSGFNPNCRDRTLKTPLHYGCLHGHETIVDTLLKAGADIIARDSLGRSCIHFAASCPSAQTLQLVLATKPELSNDVDQKKRTPLHYCVWNSSQHQVSLLRTLLDFKANSMALDEDLKTPIHHASEGGKTRAIPVLLQRGGQESMQLRDRSQKTPLELAANDRTREVLIVYSSSPMNNQDQDLKFLDQAVQGQKLANQKKEQGPQSSIVVANKQPQQSPQFPIVEKEIVSAEPPPLQVKWAPASINQWIREKFFTIMKKVQESGIRANHHLKRPYVYTGSWMEGINSMEELYGAVKDVPAGEACVRTFNILCPFDRQLPSGSGNEDVIDGFYGEMWFDGSGAVKRTEQIEEMRRKMQQEYLARITDLETEIQIKAKHLFETDQDLAQTRAQLEVTQRQNKTNSDKLQAQIDTLNKQLKSKDETISKLDKDKQQLNQTIKRLEQESEELRNQPQGISEEEVQEYMTQISELKEQLQASKDQEKTLRSKAGQLFLKSIQTIKASNEEKLSQAKAQTLAQIQLEKEKMQQERLNANKQFEFEKNQLLEEKNMLMKEKQKIQAEVLPTNAAGGMDNLQDDDAIIVLLKALKGNPPPMKQRMKTFDGDLDGSLTQDEFRQFLAALKLSQQDIHSLCRIGGFLGQKKIIGIEEWAQILQDRPKQREQFEQALFCKLLDAIKARNLTVEKMFELIDTDGSGSLNPAELKQGLKSLKIILNQKDLNNMFAIFDSDKSGSVSLEEMRETLNNYQKMREEQGEGEIIVDEQDRIQAQDEDNPYEEIESTETELKQEIKEWNIDTKDFTKITGFLKVQLINGSEINSKSLCCHIILKGGNVMEKSVILFNQSEFKQAFIFPIGQALKENLCEYVWIRLYRNSVEEENFVGDVKIMWKQTIDKPNQWVINNKFQLQNTTYIKEQSKMYKPQGFINIAMKFIPGEGVEIKRAIIGNKITATIVEEGVLEVIPIQCILKQDLKQLKEPKFFIHLRFMSIDKKIQAQLTASNDLYWEGKYLQDLKCITNAPIDSVYVKVYVETPKNLLQTNTQVLGEFYIDWSECLLNPGEFLSEKSYSLLENTKVYLKIRYVPQSMFQQIIGFREGVSKEEKKKQLTLDDMIEGTLKILFVRGKNLRADDGDTSDPYCIARIKSFDKEIKIQSKTVKCSLNPDWRDLQQIKVLMPKEGPYPPLELQLFDEDVLGDDELGMCKVDLAPCIEQPCKWSINDYFDIIDPKAKQPGQIYIQCYWVPKGMKDPNLKARDKFDSSGCADPDPNFIDGELVIKVVHARELKADSPDPYVIVNFPGGKELKTETISSSINPIFNQILRNQFKVKKETGKTPLKVLVKDSNVLSDDLIGYVDMQWEECVSHPGEWGINQVYNLSAAANSKNFGSIGFLYIQAKFIERGMIDDQAEAPLTENLFEIINSKQGIYSGSLRIFLVHARGLVVADSKASDPYVIFKVPGGKKVETLSKPDTINPSWKTIFNINVSMPKDTIQPLRVEIFDDDLVNDELMGYCTIDLLDTFNNPQVWKFNEVVDLQGDQKMQKKYKTKEFGKVYLQIMYCLQGIQNNDPPLPLTEDLDFILREQQQENKRPMKGKLYINIPVALGLRPDDGVTADPYCKLTFPDNHNVKSKQIDKTINPIFNFQYQWNCNLIKEQYKPILLQIYDSDATGDDLLGEVEIEWMECFTNPSQWMINKQYSLVEGKVYIQSKFLLPGQETTPEGIRACDTVQELKHDYGRVLGKIDVKIISASQLYNSDITGKSDPFVECGLSSETKKMQTPIKDNTLDPIWDFQGSLVIELLRCQVQMNTINFNVYDDDEVGKDFLGQCEVDLIDILEKNPGSVMLQDLPLKDPSKKGNPNLGSLKVQFVWIPDPYNEGVVGLRIPPKMYEGDLCIRFPNARQLPKGDPYVTFSLTEDMEKNYKCKNAESNQNPDWNYEEIIKISISERQILTERMKAIVKNYNSAWSDTVFGGITVLLTDLFRKPGLWINQYYQLYDGDGKLMESYVYFQAQFRTEEVQDKNIPALTDFTQFINQGKPPTFNGKLKFTYIGLKNLENKDITGLSDPFVEIKISKGSTTAFKTTTQDDKLDCFWMDCGEYLFKEVTQEDLSLLRLYINVFDYDYNSNDVLGKCELDMSKLKSGQWVNYRIPLLNEKDFPQKSEIYLQALFTIDGDGSAIQQQPKNLYDDIARQQQEEQERLRKEKEAQAAIPKLPGVLRVFAPFAKQLIKADLMGNSDPYVEFKISKGSKQIIKSKTIDDDPNPAWNFSGEFTLDMQSQEYNDIAIMCTVYDYDTIVSSDFLGFIELSLNEIFSKPGTWINGLFPLKDEHGNTGKNGVIYLQLQWVPNSIKNNVSLAQPNQIQQQVAQPLPDTQIQKPQQGILHVNLIKILGYDKKSQIKVSQGQKAFNSNLVQADVNYNLKCQFDTPESQITINLLDEKSQQIADTVINLQSIIQQPGTWINSFYGFQHSNIQPNLQQFYLQAQYRLNDQNIQEPPLLPDPEIKMPISQSQMIQPLKGKLKVAVIKAEKIKLMDGNKASNVKVSVIFNGEEKSTGAVKGAAPEWKKILDPFKLDAVKPLQINLFHDPGVFSRCVPIGEVTISDISAIFTAPNTWAIKNDFVLGGNGNGIITLYIGFIGEKDKDALTKVQ